MIKRILYYCNYDISLPDGPGTNEYEYTVSLAKHFGKKAWCVLPKPSLEVDHLDQVNVIHFTLPRLRALPRLLMEARALAKKIDDICRNEEIDVVCVRLANLPLVPWMLQNVYKRPLAIKTLGEWKSTSPPASWLGRRLQDFIDWITVSVIKNAFAVDIGMQEKFNIAQQLFKDDSRLCLIPNAANVDLFQPMDVPPQVEGIDLKGKWPVLGFLGSFPSDRGAREMIEVAYRLLPKYPDIAVVIAGSDKKLPEIKKRAKELGIADRCHFLGWVPYEEAFKMVNLMDMGFSFFDKIVVERTGNASQKVRQYLACGKPVISIPEGHAFLEENDLGTIVDPENIEQLMAAVHHWAPRVRQDATLAARLRDYAVKHLSTEKAFQDRIQFWEQTMLKGKQ